jgi:hypothetical protein
VAICGRPLARSCVVNGPGGSRATTATLVLVAD